MVAHISYTDNLRQGTDKLNAAIDQSNEAITTANESLIGSVATAAIANEALANSEDTQNQLDTIVIDGDSSVEAAQARVSTPKGETFTVLKDRLDAGEEDLAARVADFTQYVIGQASTQINVMDAPYNAVGDGVADDTSALTAFFADGEGKILILGSGKTFYVTDELIVPSNCNVFFNRSKIVFFLSGTKRGLVIGNRNRFHCLDIDMTDNGGTAGGQYQCPVTIGDISTASVRDDVFISGARVTNDKNNSVCFGIWGGSKNIIIDNVYIPSSSTIGRVCAIHWGGTGNPTAGTTHPSNIHIKNMRIGELTNPATDAAIAYISTGYNILFENVQADLVGYQAFYVYAGDYGFQYASAREKLNAMRNIKFRNISVKSKKYFAFVDGEVPLGTTTRYDMDVVFDGINAIGSGDSSSASAFNLRHCKSVVVRNFDISKHYHGVGFNTNVIGGVFRDGKIHGCYSAGVNFTNTPKNVVVDNVESYLNSTGDTLNFRAAFYLQTGDNITIRNCTMGDATSEIYQNYGINIANTVTNTIMENNHVQSVISGGAAYALGNSGVNGTTKLSRNNTADESIANKRAGADPICVNISMGTADRITREYFGTIKPTTGTYNQGDKMNYESPTTTGYIGWVCTVSGTLGTLVGVTGGITTGTKVLTVNSATDLKEGQYITIVGVSGIKQIVDISGTTVTLDSNANATVASAVVAFSAATIKDWGLIT